MLKLKIVDRGLSIDSNSGQDDPYFFKTKSLMYNYDIVGRGILVNPEVCQLLTPAGLRSEHPLATLLGWCTVLNPGYNEVRRFADHLAGVNGAFIMLAVTPNRDQAVGVVRNLKVVWDEEKQKFIPCGELKNTVYLFRINPKNGLIDSMDIDIIQPASERKLFVVESFRNDWTIPYRKLIDYKVSYAQIDYKGMITHKDKGKDGPWYLNFISRCLAFALDMPKEDIPKAICLGIKPAECDLLMVSSFTRVIHIATSGHIQLEVPLYESAIGHRIMETY